MNNFSKPELRFSVRVLLSALIGILIIVFLIGQDASSILQSVDSPKVAALIAAAPPEATGPSTVGPRHVRRHTIRTGGFQRGIPPLPVPGDAFANGSDTPITVEAPQFAQFNAPVLPYSNLQFQFSGAGSQPLQPVNTPFVPASYVLTVAVPEVSVWVAMILGFFITGIALRRRGGGFEQARPS